MEPILLHIPTDHSTKSLQLHIAMNIQLLLTVEIPELYSPKNAALEGKLGVETSYIESPFELETNNPL